MPFARFAELLERFRAVSLRTQIRLLISGFITATLIFVVVNVFLFVRQIELAMWLSRQQEAAYRVVSEVDSFLVDVEVGLYFAGYFDPEQVNDISLSTGELDQAAGSMEERVFQQPFKEVLRTDESGTVLFEIHYVEEPVLTNQFTIRQSNWFLHAREGEMYIGDVQVSADGEPYLILSVPAGDGGVVAGRLDMSRLWEIMGETQLGNTGLSYVVNRSGQIVAHRDPQVVLDYTDISERPEIQAALAAGESWHGVYKNFAGEGVRGYTISMAEGNWVVFTEVDRREAVTMTRQVSHITVGGLFVFGIIAYSLMYYLSDRLILTPVEVLRQGAIRMGAGHLDERIVTERRNELGELATEFNHMAASLQQKIAESEMLAQKATQASEYKSTLISRVSHELRNPLGGILGMSEMLQQEVFGPVSEEQDGVLQNVINSSNYLTSLLDELLEQSRLERNRVALSITDFDVRATIQRVVAIYETTARKKNLAMEVIFADDLPETLQGDSGKVEQIVANLINNAVKFTSVGSIQVMAYQPDERHWAVQVKDTGIGIPDDVQQQVFESFRQADEAITREHGGFGLGLSIVKHLTSLLNGIIALQSEVGVGSCFTVTFPVHILQEDQG